MKVCGESMKDGVDPCRSPRLMLGARDPRVLAIALFALSLGALAPVAAADGLPGPELRQARRDLRHYDLSGPTVEVIERLNHVVIDAEGADYREASFLRAVAAADLVVLSHGLARPELRNQVAAALSVPEHQLGSYLDRELSRLEIGVYEPVASDCRWALRVLSEGSADAEMLRAGSGTRRDVMFINAVVLGMGQDDPVEALRSLSPDPCREEASVEEGNSGEEEGDSAARAAHSTCRQLQLYGAQGRQAAAAFVEANDALLRLQRVSVGGDPLTASLADLVASHAAALRSAQLTPAPRLPSDAQVHQIGALGRAAHPELLLWISGGRVHYAFVPHVRVDASGISLVASGEPALPQSARLAVVRDNGGGIAPFNSLTEALERLVERHPVSSLGLAADSQVESRTISRVLISLRRAGMPAPTLIAAGADGEARGLPIEVIAGGTTTQPLSLFIRQGGYTWGRHGRRSETIPRIRTAEGLLFDLQGLQARAEAAGSVPISIRYMGAVSWGTVLDAAFRLPSLPSPVSVVIY